MIILRRYQNERDALRKLSDTGFTPSIILEGYVRSNGLQLDTFVLLLEKRDGQRLRTCWPHSSRLEKEIIRDAMMRFFEISLRRGIYHDDLQHLRNILWDPAKQELTVLDFELIGVQWQGSHDPGAIHALAEQEMERILKHI